MANNARTIRLFGANIRVEATYESDNYDQSTRTLRLFGANIDIEVADERGDHDQNQDHVTQTLPASNSSPLNSSSGLSEVHNEVKVADEQVVDEPNGQDQKGPQSCTAGPSTVVVDGGKRKGKRKLCEGIGHGKKKRSIKRKRADEGEEQRPIEDIPAELLQAVEELNGTRPFFLYGKQLEESDIRKDQNRLFITDRRKFLEIWSLEELEQEVYVAGVDANKNKYDFKLKIWDSLDQLVVKKQWFTLIRQNGAEKGYWVQVWGFKVDGRTCLAISFLRSRNPSSASTSGTKNSEGTCTVDPNSASTSGTKNGGGTCTVDPNSASTSGTKNGDGTSIIDPNSASTSGTKNGEEKPKCDPNSASTSGTKNGEGISIIDPNSASTSGTKNGEGANKIDG